MALVQPVPGEPAATVDGDERLLLIADYHAGIEAALGYERGIEIPSRAQHRRERLVSILERTTPDRLVVLGDLMHSIGEPGGAERGELEVLFEQFPGSLDVTVVKGNHDGAIESWLGDGGDDGTGRDEGVRTDGLSVVPGAGVTLGDVGVCHGHTWPARDVLSAAVVCIGHEHPQVRLEDEVGGSRVERAWVRGSLRAEGFADRSSYEDLSWIGSATASTDSAETANDPKRSPPDLVVFPAFNELAGGTWVNVPDQSFLSPFLPEGLADGEVYLLDGTRLGPYESV